MSNLDVKIQIVTEISANLQKSAGVVLTDYRGLTVAEDTKLRAKLRESGVEYQVLKNTMVKRAADAIGLEGLDPYLAGPTAVAFSEDPVAPAKVLSEFSKTNRKFSIKAGILEGKVIDAEGVKALADLPAREVLLAMVLRGIQAPLTGMANVLQGPIRKLGYALEEVRKLKEA
ncbi:MAG: 50S ribosomal protein L10 [Peptococcaceae bacterium]|jgi:large subunit ribosomal protein L10|nr:50S ribosomal protein L10 [Peptococcaceae bacterium]